MRRLILAAILAASPWTASAADDLPPFRDPALPIEARLDDALARLSLAEKAAVLNYTRFEYAGLEAAGSPLVVTATVTNTGSRAGDEVVQLYLVPPPGEEPRPRRMLRGFERVSLAPGESKQVRFTVPDEKLAFWNTAANRFDVPRGGWGVEVGASSADIRLRTALDR